MAQQLGTKFFKIRVHVKVTNVSIYVAYLKYITTTCKMFTLYGIYLCTYTDR